jgi:Uma2 family endonuclease
MTAVAEEKMSADEFLVWAESQNGRWQLVEGVPALMAPERAVHALTKFAAQKALAAAIDRGRIPCQMFPDGMTVRADQRNAFELDALVNCGAKTPANAVEAPNPIVVVEVLSPSTAAHDHGAKFTGYFSIPSIAHYLILDPERRVLIHHKRGQGDVIETRILTEGVLRLDPPGLEAPVVEMFAAE